MKYIAIVRRPPTKYPATYVIEGDTFDDVLRALADKHAMTSFPSIAQTEVSVEIIEVNRE